MNLIERKRVRDSVAACTNCKLHKQCKGPVPFLGPSPSRIAIVGEAPGASEDEIGQPFVGASGKLLRRELTRLGLDVNTVAFLNVVSCWPNRKPATPTRKEMEACRENFIQQVGVIQPEFMLILGATALSAFWRSMTVKQVRGHWWIWSTDSIAQPIWCFASIHPAAVLRDNQLREGFVADLESFLLGYVYGPWPNYWCAKCDRYTTIRLGLEGVGEWGVSLCAKCFSQVSKPYAVQRSNQEAML